MKKRLPVLGLAALLAAIVAILIAVFRSGADGDSGAVAGGKQEGAIGKKGDPAGTSENPAVDPIPGVKGNGTGTVENPAGTGTGDPLKPVIKPVKVGGTGAVQVDLEIDDFNQFPTPPGTAEDWHRLVIDKSTDAKMRVVALHALRVNNPERRTEDVVLAMLELFRSSEDLALRIGICRNLKGVESASMREALISTLQTDSNEFVRRQAANALGPMATHPDVRTALENAKATDASQRVKNEATLILEPK